MPTIEQNKRHWNELCHWSDDGEEWSARWGGHRNQWYGSLLPRIKAFVPTNTILEIAPGYGRWTSYLKNLCSRLVVVDLSPKCIERCRQRFASDSHISYFENDGRSLNMIEDRSIDFIFSFDSLVHVDKATIKSYVADIARKLKPDGVCFLHHSNLGQYPTRVTLHSKISRVPKLPALLRRLHLYEDLTPQWRAEDVAASDMVSFADEYGLSCISQELITWETKTVLIDCLTTMTPLGSKWGNRNHIRRNVAFMAEAIRLKHSPPSQ